MSEQLVVRFEHNGLSIAAVFGRWAAYTASAATITDDLIWGCESHVKLSRRTSEDLACYRVTRMLLGLGCKFEDWDEERIRAEELERRFRKGVCNVYVFDSCLWADMVCWTNRRTIEAFKSNAIGTVVINLDQKTVRFDSWQCWSLEQFTKDCEFMACHRRLIADFDPTEEMRWNDFRSNLLPILMDRQTLKEGHFKSKDGLHVYTAIES